MTNQKRYYKKRYLAVALVFIAITALYVHFNPINEPHELTDSASNIAQHLTSIESCVANDSCNEKINHPIATIESVTTPPLEVITPIATTDLAVGIHPVSTIAPINAIYSTKPPIIIKLQGKEIIKESDFSREDIHQCRIEFDKQSVLKINQIIEQFSYEIELNKTTYEIHKYLTLNIISPTLSDNFNEELVYKIQTLLQIYRQSFGFNLQKKSEINLVILPSQVTYEDFISHLSLDSANTQGLFWARSNYAFVAYNHEQQAGETAFHEAVHALNFSLVGLQSRWLNEGLAELFEKMKVTLEEGNNTVSLRLPFVNNPPVPMGYQELIYSEQQWWDTDQTGYLYSSSLYFLSYLFGYKEGIDIISILLSEERKNPCSTLPMDHYFQIIDENIFYLPTSFDEWFYANR